MNRSSRQRLIGALAMLGVFTAHAGAQSSGGPYRVDRSVVAGGGAALNGGAFQLQGTLGQSTTATLSATSYRFYGGFWAPAASGPMPDLIFVEPHPTDATKEIRYASLEGREAGTYFRGSGRLVNGHATIEVPADFEMVTSEEGLTVQLTPIGQPASLFLITTNLQQIEVGGNADVAFNYHVNGVRKSFAGYAPIHDNVTFVPRSAAEAKDLAAMLPAESVRRLIANGTLNADHSVNRDTAHRLGWDQRAGWNNPLQPSTPPSIGAPE